MSIKIFKVGSFSYTPFVNYFEGDMEYLKKKNIEFVDAASEADILIAQNYKKLKKHLWRGLLGKKFLIWTLEPRFDTNFKSEKNIFGSMIRCHFMNIYTKDVFVSNLTFHGHLIRKKMEFLRDNYSLTSKRIIALMSYYKGIDSEPLIRNGQNIDLIGLRSKLALAGYKAGMLDIFGKGWPNEVSTEDSRDGNWVDRKKELMSDYTFNLCFENTAVPNYMTEKIWNSIENYCLPIYYGANTSAYDIFPKESFIDYSDFNSPEELFQFISEMTDQEFVKRMNRCIEIYNGLKIDMEKNYRNERQKMLDCIVAKAHTI